MTATTAPSPWPAPMLARAQRAPWRFARELHTPGGVVLLWALRRNCSLTPRQLLAAVGSVGIVSLVVAGAFWWHGAPLVAPFAGLEILLLAIAVLVHARHVGDRELLTLDGGELRVEHHRGRRIDRTAFRATAVRVEPQRGDTSLIELSAHGRHTHVGRYLHPYWRPALAQELRRALRSDWATAGASDPT